jgi:hypothetical protein
MTSTHLNIILICLMVALPFLGIETSFLGFLLGFFIGAISHELDIRRAKLGDK